MDLNASPLPEDDDDNFQQHLEEENAPEEREEHVEHHEETEPVQSVISISRRDREERMQRMKRQRSDDRPAYAYQPPVHDDTFQNKKKKPFNRIPPGWVDCPACGQEICCMVPSKVPLSESFNDVVPPGKRYSSRQVIHQQRVMNRKLGLIIDLTNTTRYYSTSEWNKKGIKHVKIACRGRDSVPDNESVNSFVYEENPQTQAVMSNDDILGDKIPDDQQSFFRQFCYQMLKLHGGRSAQFPGSHPVSLTRLSFASLRAPVSLAAYMDI